MAAGPPHREIKEEHAIQAVTSWESFFVISVVFVVAVLNLLLGAALAMLLERQIVVPVPSLRPLPEPDDPETVLEIPVVPAEERVDVRSQLPERWLKILDETDSAFTTLVEATVEVLQLDVQSYHGDLLDIEDLVRSAIRKKKPEAIRDAIQVLVALNEEWMDRQNEATQVLDEGKESLEKHDDIAARLKQLLSEQTALIEESCATLLSVDVHRENADAEIIESLVCMTTMAHQLRDVVARSAVDVVCQAGQVMETSPECRTDKLTGLPNRLAIEWTFDQWWQEDVAGKRPVSAALIDIDHFAAFNSQAGTRVGDRLLRSMAGLLERLCSDEEDGRLFFSYGGQRFFIFCGECEPRVAVSSLENIRQTVAAARLECEGEQHALTVRCGITGGRPGENVESLCQRLEELVRAAGQAGGNCICVEDDSGREVIPPGEATVDSHVVIVE